MPPEPVTIGRATLYNSDCRDILPTLPRVDAVVTDPPYGVQFAEWDAQPPCWWLDLVLDRADSILFTPGIENMRLWPKPTWVGAYSYPVGFKAAKGGQGCINCWEPVLVYGKNCLPIDHKHFKPTASEKVVGHPCPKPLPPFKWLVSKAAPQGGTILDPFLGSGTTGVAAVIEGRDFIGIEKDPDYFDIACKRIEDAQRQGDMFIAA